MTKLPTPIAPPSDKQRVDAINSEFVRIDAHVAEGDAGKIRWYISTAIAFDQMGGAANAYLVGQAAHIGSVQASNQSAESWLAPVLMNMNFQKATEAEVRAMKKRSNAFGDIIRACRHLAKPLDGLANITPDKLEPKFADGFQRTVKKALTEIRNGLEAVAPGDNSPEDVVGADPDENEGKVLAGVLAKLREADPLITLSDLPTGPTTGYFVMAGYPDGAGGQATKMLRVPARVLADLMREVDLSLVDPRVMGVADAVHLATELLPPRSSKFAKDASEVIGSATKMRPSIPTTLWAAGRFETSLGHEDAPEMIVTARPMDTVGMPSGPYVVSAHSRAAFTRNVVPHDKREVYKTWGGWSNPPEGNGFLSFTRSSSGKAEKLVMMPAGSWGSSKLRDPYAMRLSSEFRSVGRRELSGAELTRLRTEFLDTKDARKDRSVTIRLDGAVVGLTFGTAAELVFAAVVEGERLHPLTVTVPGREFVKAVTNLLDLTTDAPLAFGGDAKGVLETSVQGRGARHSVFQASVSKGGVRSSAGLFVRYDKKSFAAPAQAAA
ncbi:hypothetical protein [Brevundimonas sp.]